MKIQGNLNPATIGNQQVKFKGVGVEAPIFLEKLALRQDAFALKNSEELYPVVDKLGITLDTVKKYFSENKLVYANMKKEQKRGQEPRFWVVMMPEQAHLKRLNENGYKKEEFIARSFSWLSGDSDVFFENVMKKAEEIQKNLIDALQFPKLKK